MDRPDTGTKGGGVTPPPDLIDAAESEPDAEEEATPSLMADLDALIADGKTYFEAELTYQKSRAGFAANRLKWTAIYGAAAFGFLHLAGIALTVGAVIALTPLTGPWLATLLVVGLLIAGAAFFALRLRRKLNDVRDVFEGDEP